MEKQSKYNFNFTKNDYLTPPELIEKLLSFKDEREFDLDVCCRFKNIPAKKHYVFGETDGLKAPWERFNWMNPPFDTGYEWVKKAVAEQQKGNTTFSILPTRTETAFWQEYIIKNPLCLVQHLRKGLNFIDPETMKPVTMQKKNPQTGMIEETPGVYKNALSVVIFAGVPWGVRVGGEYELNGLYSPIRIIDL